MELKALIVDDEYPAREELRFLLKKYENIKVVGEAANVSEAITLINSLDYQLVFLDINFPKSNGIEIGNYIRNMEHPPCIVYVTAYESYALDAFDVSAIDYLLKPIDEQKLERAVNRAVRAYQNKTDQFDGLDGIIDESQKTEENKLDTGRINRLTAEYNGKIVPVDMENIYCFFAEENYVFIKLYDKKMFTKFTLTILEKKLDENIFFRAHRSYIVNLNKVQEIKPSFNGTCSLVLSDKEHTSVPVSRTQTRLLRNILHF